jgi:hypothetical protein
MNPYPPTGSRGPYAIGLLNDLHHHFPDLLYSHEQFTSVQDVLQYIIDVANTSPYPQNRTAHQSRTLPSTYSTRNHTIHPFSSSSSMPYSFSFQSAPSRQRQSVSPAVASASPAISSISRVTIPLYSSSSSIPAGGLGDQYVNSLLQELLGGRSSRSSSSSSDVADLYFQVFQRMIDPASSRVTPTQEQIDRETTVQTAEPEWICSICQDTNSTNETTQCRIINHCGHAFHLSCIDTWFQTHSSCPMCRYDICSQESDESSE